MKTRVSRIGLYVATATLAMFMLAACGGGGGGGGGVSKKPTPPVADFTAGPTNPFEGQSVSFTNLSSGSPTTWSWDFDNNGSEDSTAQNPTNVYNTAGSYAVKLTVSNNGGNNTEIKLNYINVHAPLAAAFTASPTTVVAGNMVNFTDQSTGSPTSWSWDFNADSVADSTAQNPSYTYLAAGTFDVKLTVTSIAGNDTMIKNGYVTVTPPVGAVVDIDVDSNRNGIVSALADDDTNEEVWNATQGAVFYYNLDDDDANGDGDFNDTSTSGTDINDLSRIVIRQCTAISGGGTVTINVSVGAQNRIRIFRDTGAGWAGAYSTGASFALPAVTLAAGDIELGIEARDRMGTAWGGQVSLTLTILNTAMVTLGTDVVVLRVAPPLMSTNLWRTTQYQVVNIPNGGDENSALRSAMQGICTTAGFGYAEAFGPTYSYDRWLQDSSEFGVVQLPSSTSPRRVIPQVMQLARWRPIDDWCEDYLLAPDFDFFERFSPDNESCNYGGNFEVVPPYTGKSWGQVMFGGGNGNLLGTTTPVNRHMIQAYRDFFDTASIQGPQFEITSEWLAVGHVDEYTMFVPAPNTARGWVCLIASPARAVQILQATQTAGSGAAPVFAGRAGWATTVNAILGNAALLTLNQQAQVRIDQGRNQIKAATGLTDADFIHLPTMFEYVGSNYCAAYNPGVVNLVCMPAANGTTYFAIPDPEGPDIAGVDQWQADINALLAPLATVANPFNVTYVNVFFSYHDLLGEAHCGSNFVRAPPADDWWNK